MAGINKVILVGNLGQDPQVNYTQDGKAIATISMATSETWNDKTSGEKREKTEWHRVVIFGKLVDIVKQYLHKGSKVYIEGKLQTRKWQDKNGQDRWTTEVVLQGFGSTLQMLDSRAMSGSDAGTTSSENNPAPAPATTTNEVAPVIADDFDDDIPF